MERKRKEKAWCGAWVLFWTAVFVWATWRLAEGDPFVRTWYYCFAWWPYILVCEAVLRCTGGRSRLFERPLGFLALLPLSVFLWGVFEAANFRLSNWHYVGLPPSRLTRWWGYWIAYATVLPGLFVTTRLLEHLGAGRWNPPWPPIPHGWTLRHAQTLRRLGAFCVLAPLILPRFAFPLIWLGFFFLLDPWNAACRGRSLMQDWERGHYGHTLRLLGAGLLCGFLWELWNYWAGSKWVYTVPFVGDMKLFEMPVLGFLGFAPFALECFVMVESVRLVWEHLRRNLPPAVHGLVALNAFLLSLIVDFLVFAGIDHFTVQRWMP
ncbi:hypothetical protein SAMN02746041_02032 [Desulfacinum hydrothermale DSM 13146]|uniref:Uncharacterized protein n=1 Tax=Desulfacinum hydrothermale DSM 13146 TaxID=1121390 RepID=A0A1W1XL54_9BACT|nr:hypothetical protein [Desulfacinum hydrothermale]SMC24544.1 hypothetical protein SAMN02746041_02032 [Desulfacinum hydrothermale DSM 13146]